MLTKERFEEIAKGWGNGTPGSVVADLLAEVERLHPEWQPKWKVTCYRPRGAHSYGAIGSDGFGMVEQHREFATLAEVTAHLREFSDRPHHVEPPSK